MRQRRSASQKTTIHRHAPTAQCIAKNHHPSACANGAVHRKKPPSIGMRQRAVHHKKPSSIGMTNGAVHRKNRRRAVSYVSTGLARLPRDIDSARNYRRRAVVEIPSPHRHRRGATALSVTRYAERSGCVPGFCAPSHLACRRYATTCGGTADSTR